MNSAFVGYEELSRSRRVVSTSASVDNTLLDLLNSSYPTKAEFINCFSKVNYFYRAFDYHILVDICAL